MRKRMRELPSLIQPILLHNLQSIYKSHLSLQLPDLKRIVQIIHRDSSDHYHLASGDDWVGDRHLSRNFLEHSIAFPYNMEIWIREGNVCIAGD